MGIIVTIILLATGATLAWAFDNFVLHRHRPTIQLEGESLIRALEKSDAYANLRSSKEISPLRHDDRDRNSSSDVAIDRDGGDGGKVLRINQRRKM